MMELWRIFWRAKWSNREGGKHRPVPSYPEVHFLSPWLTKYSHGLFVWNSLGWLNSLLTTWFPFLFVVTGSTWWKMFPCFLSFAHPHDRPHFALGFTWQWGMIAVCGTDARPVLVIFSKIFLPILAFRKETIIVTPFQNLCLSNIYTSNPCG